MLPKKKKCYSLSFPKLGERNSTRALQSSPFHISGGVPWAWQTNGQRTEILVSNIGLDVQSGCLENFALGNSRGSSDFPKGAQSQGKVWWSEGIHEGKFFRQPLRTFHCFFSDIWIKKKQLRTRPGQSVPNSGFHLVGTGLILVDLV